MGTGIEIGIGIFNDNIDSGQVNRLLTFFLLTHCPLKVSDSHLWTQCVQSDSEPFE